MDRGDWNATVHGVAKSQAKLRTQCTCMCVRMHTHTHTVEYYSIIKKKEILPFAIAWMNLEGIMLSKISQEKDKYYMISLICRI